MAGTNMFLDDLPPIPLVDLSFLPFLNLCLNIRMENARHRMIVHEFQTTFKAYGKPERPHGMTGSR